jgi:hypothetical protein
MLVVFVDIWYSVYRLPNRLVVPASEWNIAAVAMICLGTYTILFEAANCQPHGARRIALVRPQNQQHFRALPSLIPLEWRDVVMERLRESGCRAETDELFRDCGGVAGAQIPVQAAIMAIRDGFMLHEGIRTLELKCLETEGVSLRVFDDNNAHGTLLTDTANALHVLIHEACMERRLH